MTAGWARTKPGNKVHWWRRWGSRACAADGLGSAPPGMRDDESGSLYTGSKLEDISQMPVSAVCPDCWAAVTAAADMLGVPTPGVSRP